MMPKILDQVFPAVMFFYGFLIIVMLHSPVSNFFRQDQMAPWILQWMAILEKRKSFYFLLFWVGGLWTLQNLLFAID